MIKFRATVPPAQNVAGFAKAEFITFQTSRFFFSENNLIHSCSATHSNFFNVLNIIANEAATKLLFEQKSFIANDLRSKHE